ncbi:uncharacterized protein C3orf62-like isoform X2 [Macrotis lagotis]
MTVAHQDYIALFTPVESLGQQDHWYRPDYKTDQQTTDKFGLWSFPKILMVHLKKLSYNRCCKDKLDTVVECPPREDVDRYLNDEANSPFNNSHQESAETIEYLLDMIDHTSMETIEELTEKIEIENELNWECSGSEGSLFKEEFLALFKDENMPKAMEAEASCLKPTLDDEKIIETILDLEEDYHLMTSFKHHIK